MNNSEVKTEKVPESLLFSSQLEAGVLTCILNNNDNFFSSGKVLCEDIFHDTKNRKLFKTIQKGISDGKTVDLMYVVSETARSTDKDAYAIDELMANFTGYVSDVLFGEYLNTLVELAKRRRMWLLGQKLIRLGVDMTYTVDDAMKEVEAALEAENGVANEVMSLKDANKKMMERVRDNITGKSDTFLPTGFAFLDDHCGFQTGDFNVIAAASSSGKTSLATKIAVNVAGSGKPVMCYSMEMMAEQIAARINSPIAKVSSSLIQYKKLYEDQYNEVVKAVRETDELPIYFDDSSTSSAEAIFTSIRANSRRYGIKLFIIDYLQILSSVKAVKDEQSFLGEVSRKLKNLAKELHVNITVLSQLSRNNQDPMPTMDRLRASGQIAEASDTVLLIWRPSLYGKTSYKNSNAPVEGTAEIIIAKGRNVGTGSFIVGFDPSTTNFYDISAEQRLAWDREFESGKKGKNKAGNDIPAPINMSNQKQLLF